MQRDGTYMRDCAEWARQPMSNKTCALCASAGSQPSFRRVRRVEARSLEAHDPASPKFIPLELGACAQDMGLPREGGPAEWRQMWLGPVSACQIQMQISCLRTATNF